MPPGAVRLARQIRRDISSNTGARADSIGAVGRVGDRNASPPRPGDGAAGGGSRTANARAVRMASVAITPTPSTDRRQITRSWPDMGPNTPKGVNLVGR